MRLTFIILLFPFFIKAQNYLGGGLSLNTYPKDHVLLDQYNNLKSDLGLTLNYSIVTPKKNIVCLQTTYFTVTRSVNFSLIFSFRLKRKKRKAVKINY